MPDIRAMQRALRGAGATVLTITMPDISEVMPLAKRVRPRLDRFNAAVREVSRETGTIVVDLAAQPFAGDPRFWSGDRLHANSEGHRRVALALAEALGVDAGDWRAALPSVGDGPGTAAVVLRESAWVATHLLPWLGRRMLRRQPQEVRTCKRPDLLPVD